MRAVRRKVQIYPEGDRREVSSSDFGADDRAASDRGRRSFSCRMPHRLPLLRGEQSARNGGGFRD